MNPRTGEGAGPLLPCWFAIGRAGPGAESGSAPLPGSLLDYRGQRRVPLSGNLDPGQIAGGNPRLDPPRQHLQPRHDLGSRQPVRGEVRPGHKDGRLDLQCVYQLAHG
jgi:hypothetical protein